MSSSHPLIVARQVSKAYTISQGVRGSQSHTTFAEALAFRLKHPLARAVKETLWAIRDLELVVNAGETVGIVGRNGAGKSTLLRMICGVTEPTAGEILLYGRVGSLLEIGTGFHPELTGRENIFLNGSILGMRRSEIQRQFDTIVAFAGVERFLDTPVKRYSSGMYLRLAFAVAAHLDTEILLVDEVLAVGDAEFQHRCLDRMRDAASMEGRAIVFVSHNLPVVEGICSREVLLDRGGVILQGSPSDVSRRYVEMGGVGGEVYRVVKPFLHWRGLENRIDLSGLSPKDDLRFVLSFETGDVDLHELQLDLALTDENDMIVVHTRSEFVTSGLSVSRNKAFRVEYTVRSPRLVPGRYFLTIYAYERGPQVLFWADRIDACDISSASYFGRLPMIGSLKSPVIPEFEVCLLR
jgi:lipopolysaccharide transport system ATP-binding protein